MRIALLRALTLAFAAATVTTEALSLFGAVARVPVAVCWVVLIAAAVPFARRIRFRRPEPVEVAALAVIALIAGVTAWVALLSPPNSADALSYHLPRVLLWTQHRNVAFFPVHYLNQIMLQPVAEYAMLHLYLLAGGDYLVNLVQFAAFVGSIAGVSALAESLGLDRRAQAMAAIFCATLPNAILQASGAKNDLVLALFLVAAALFVRRREYAMFGLAAGLALGTKGTAYLFLPPLLLAVAWPLRARALAFGAAGVLLINGPQFARNIGLSGSPLGFDSAHGDGAFRWRNETLGWRATVSNMLRNTSEQLGARSPAWNQGVYNAVIAAHRQLGLDPQDPATTWRWSEFKPPINANHEANANNRWHLLVLVGAVRVALWRRDRAWLGYAAGVFAGFVLFCFYLKWQPYFSRLEIPLFIAAAPLGAMALSAVRPKFVGVLICAALVSNARLPVTENWTRPLAQLRTQPRNDSYFNDMAQWDNRATYLQAIERTAATGCPVVGTDISVNHLEYPFQALLLQRNPRVRFAHSGVQNASAKYPQPGPACAVLCLDCAGMAEKLELHRKAGTPETIGRFVLFTRETNSHQGHGTR